MYIKMDPDQISVDRCIQIPGMKNMLYPFQWLGVYFAAKRAREGANECIIEDEMGYGKICFLSTSHFFD